MRRREFIAAVGSALAAPRILAQPVKSGSIRRIGFLALASDANPKLPSPQRLGSIQMQKLGWIDGENVVWERAFADYETERLSGLAEALLRKGVEIILTDGPESTLAAARATKTVPIVFGNVTWPVEQGLIDSFARPGRNVTGVTVYTGVEVTNKRCEFLREVAPKARRMYWLWPGSYAEKVSGGRFDMQTQMGDAARALGFEVRFHDVTRVADVEAALAEAASWGAEVLNVSGMHAYVRRQRVVDTALRHRLPSATPSSEMTEAGCLLSYGPSPTEFPQTTARYFAKVDRILQGENPADLPVERPNKYDLILNMKTAKALALRIPPAMVLRADRLIE